MKDCLRWHMELKDKIIAPFAYLAAISAGTMFIGCIAYMVGYWVYVAYLLARNLI